MAERLVLHIGVQKSGTTYLQQMLQDRVAGLAEIGVLYPLPTGRRARRSRVNHHEIATYGLLGEEYPWVNWERAATERGWWERLQKQVREWSGTAIISAEALSVVRAEAAGRTIEAFGVPDNTDVFITARGFGKLLPSAWQQHIRNGRSMGFDTFMHRFAEQRDQGWDVLEKSPESHWWRAFAMGRLAKRWASIVGTGRVTFVTNPGSPADLLWHRFLEAIDLGDMSGIPAPETASAVHGGMTASEAEVLRLVNANLLAAGWSRDAVRRLGNRIIQALGSRDERGPRLGIRPEFRDQVGAWSAEDLSDLRESGIRVIGDINELRYNCESEPPEPTSSDVVEAAGVAVRIAAEWVTGP